jgi:Fe-S-cluster containining protein
MKDCNQCGKCCIKYSDGALSATIEEIELWEIFKPEISRFVKNGEIWHDPDTGEKLTRCPFLHAEPSAGPLSKTKYTCSIYLDRPEDCRHYPSSVPEMIRDECEMIEAIDLIDQNKAQHKLDELMSDLR